MRKIFINVTNTDFYLIIYLYLNEINIHINDTSVQFSWKYTRVLTLLLYEELYPVLLAKFECKISISEQDIVIKINEFNENCT